MIEAPVIENELDRLQDLSSLNLAEGRNEERFDRLARLAKKALGVEMAYLALIDDDRQWLKAKCGVAIEESRRDASFCGHAIANDDLMVVPDALRDERFFDNPLVTGEPFIRFYAGYPLKGPRGHNVGTFCVADSMPREFTAEDRQLLIEYAQLAQRELSLLDVIESQQGMLDTQKELEMVRRSLNREIREAADFVRQKLPDRFENDKVRLDWAFIESNQLGGDMFGVEAVRDDQYLVYLLDVAGHGIGASLLAISAQNTLRQLLGRLDGPVSPASVLRHLNQEFQMEHNQNRFFTMWCGFVDLSKRTLHYANAGHLPAVIYDPEFTPSRLGNSSMIIGVDPDAEFTDHSLEFAPDSRLVLFSDGIVEELDEQDNQFGRDRLEEAYRNRCFTCGCQLDSILDQVRQWNGNRPFADDVSLVELTLK